ncbi:hypothetical protein [Nostoc sp. WHI]|nr:hypothetical protein [Nostoc sp. WHI]
MNTPNTASKKVALQQLKEERQRYQDLLIRLQERGIDPEQLL